MLYRDMKEKMSARCHEFGYKNVFQEEKIDNINNLFDFSLTLETNTNKLDLARIDIDTKTHTRRFFDRIFDGTNDPILPSEGFDPLLLFRFLCTQKDGMEVFLQNQDSISFNFAKMVSKGPLFESLCDISFSNVSFKINDKQQILARYGVKLVLNKHDRAYQITSLIEESSRERNAKVVHFKDLKAIATMKSLGIKGVYESKDNLLTIPSDFDLAQKVA